MYLYLCLNTLAFSNESTKDYLYKEGVPKEISSEMTLAQVEYIDYNGNYGEGIIVVNKKVAKEVVEIFQEIKNQDFKLKKLYQYQNIIGMMINPWKTIIHQDITIGLLLIRKNFLIILLEWLSI